MTNLTTMNKERREALGSLFNLLNEPLVAADVAKAFNFGELNIIADFLRAFDGSEEVVRLWLEGDPEGEGYPETVVYGEV